MQAGVASIADQVVLDNHPRFTTATVGPQGEVVTRKGLQPVSARTKGILKAKAPNTVAGSSHPGALGVQEMQGMPACLGTQRQIHNKLVR